jgi:hypothetical protein
MRIRIYEKRPEFQKGLYVLKDIFDFGLVTIGFDDCFALLNGFSQFG